MSTSQTASPLDSTTEIVVRKSERKRTATSKVLAMQAMATGTGTSKSKRIGPAARRGKRATETKRVVRLRVPTITPHVPPPIDEAAGTSVPPSSNEDEAAKTAADSPESSPVGNHETTDLTVEPPSVPLPANVVETDNEANGANESSEPQASVAPSGLEAAAIKELKTSFMIKKLAREFPYNSNGLVPVFTWDKERPSESDFEESAEDSDDTDTFSEDLSFSTTASFLDAMAKAKAFVALAKECDGISDPEPSITAAQDEKTIQQNVENEQTEPNAPGSSSEAAPTAADENKKAVNKGKGRAAAKPAKKTPTAKAAKLPTKRSRSVKPKATKASTTKVPAASNASDEADEKENVDANVEEATVDTTIATSKVVDGPSTSPSRKPLSGIGPIPQSEAADRGVASGSQPRMQAQKPKSIVAAPSQRYNLRALKAADTDLEEGPKRKRARY